MATHLHQLLRSLCWNTEWNYAVFWKVKHLARMVLTWEDGYYNNQYKLDSSDSKSLGTSLDDLQYGHFAKDFLGEAVAKMSYHVYSLGEGIVGQVAISGNHQWIFSGEHAMNSYLSLELCNGWQAQFAAGIKTIVVAAVAPYGVVQFGSLNKVNENLQFLAHIRDAFASLQGLAFHMQTPMSGFGLISENALEEAVGSAKLVQVVPADIKQSTNLLESNYSSNSSRIQNECSNDNRQVCYSSQSCLTELHEALGPGFLKQCHPFPCEVEKPEDSSTLQMPPKATESSMFMSDPGADNLLDAVVANFRHKDAFESRDSFSNSESMMTTERMPYPSINTSHTVGSSHYSLDCSSLLEESLQKCLMSSDSCSIRSSTSDCREQLVRSVEPGKANKKRARPGENSRPRPRDRQLIQDRIKELRELVPNGSKCSIDSLLERTIKHMAFMQNVTKHSDKLSKCAKSKGGSEMGVLGSGYEQGSSWAVEVGGHMKICPILVENLSMNGQMLIEMLCDDCDHFLEISDSIRSLGLTILKGSTDNHGDKTWMRFVVEGQSNHNLHRMDVLWSLVQILQSKTTL
ncbi:transcription factor EMB1444-like [Silene latifolia]|uniref:transcription factor EMB1444-like n=1 Tax=Silene latifolia TaxID=37657 RepID=UPI003D7838F8